MYVDREGLDIAVIENGVTDGNPFGHTAIAITGAGVYSSGNGYPARTSIAKYLHDQSFRRSSMIYIIPTTPAQDTAALAVLRANQEPGAIGIFVGNCSSRSNAALDAAGMPVRGMLHILPRSSRQRAVAAGADGIYLPQGVAVNYSPFAQFEPNP